MSHSHEQLTYFFAALSVWAFQFSDMHPGWNCFLRFANETVSSPIFIACGLNSLVKMGALPVP